MSGSRQTWPFEQIPAMSGYPPKDSEYDSYWSHRNADRPQVRFAFLVPPSRCEQLLVRAFGFLGKFLKRCGAISLARTQRRCRMVEGRGSFWRRPWRQVRNFTFGFLTRIKFKIVTHELSSVDLDFRHVPHERIGIIRDKCRFIGSKATRRGRGALKEEPDPNGAQA